MTIYTVGHSTHSIEKLIDLLRNNGVEAIADVRSFPYSRRNPQFNRPLLKGALSKAGIKYVFLGKELGARADDPTCYEAGRVKYDRLAARAEFRLGIERVVKGAKQYRLALLCAERDPITCHRTILVARELTRQGNQIAHIDAAGRIESHDAAMNRLMDSLKLPTDDLYVSRAELLERAYQQQEARIAYVEQAEESEEADITWA